MDVIDIEIYEKHKEQSKSAPSALAADDSRAMRWLLTINHSEGMQDEYQSIIKNDMKSIKYACMADEIGLESKIYHSHIFIQFSQTQRFSYIKKHFPNAHIDLARGNPQECKDYIFKEGKWLNSDKEETNIKESHWELGNIESNQGKRSDIEQIRDLILEGKSSYEIKMLIPSALKYESYMESFRQQCLYEKYSKELREVEVIFLFGNAGTGKTSTIYESNNMDDVYFTSPGTHPFDLYKGQSVIVFDDFRDTDIPLNQMLRYLDRYPCTLAARFADKIACYTKVYISSNISLYKMYECADYYSRNAFKRRITRYYEYYDREIFEYKIVRGEKILIDTDINVNSEYSRKIANRNKSEKSEIEKQYSHFIKLWNEELENGTIQ